MRPTWDEIWMEVAFVIGQRSKCVRSHVGCVIVSSTNEVCAVAYNGPPAGLKLTESQMCSDWCPRAQTGGSAAYYDDCHSSHAEANALVRGDAHEYKGGTLYCSRTPCFTCAKIIANSGISRVVLTVALEDAQREPERSIAMLEDSGLVVVRWEP